MYAQNVHWVLERFAAGPLAKRLRRPVNACVVALDRELDDPLPVEATNLDLVLINIFYHDALWLETDRDRMNRAVFSALKPGGRYVVIDSSARPGSGVRDAITLHRIDEQFVRAEIERAGFAFVTEDDFLRNPRDRRDWNPAGEDPNHARGSMDRFVHCYQRPRAVGESFGASQ